MAIKAVLFDYGGVLTQKGKRGYVAMTIAELYGIDIGWQKYEEIGNQFKMGLIGADEYFGELKKIHRSDRQLTAAEWNQVSRDVFVKSKPVYDVAAKLRKHGIKTGIFSNIFKITADVLRAIGNYDGFDPVLLSYEAHLMKPQPAFFQLAIKKLGCRPSEILLVDDQEKNIRPAKELGFQTLMALTEKQIVRGITKLIELENGLRL